MKRGSIHWAHLDKRRPVVVISPDRRNELASDVIVVPCSTSGGQLRWHVRLERGEGGLSSVCFAHCESVSTLRKDVLDDRPIGKPLSPAKLRMIELAVLSALGIANLQ
ncbi:MAG: type II toxin-antitoxin system PemK/MazF family toxin [Myxococcaceae bacterium]